MRPDFMAVRLRAVRPATTNAQDARWSRAQEQLARRSHSNAKEDGQMSPLNYSSGRPRRLKPAESSFSLARK